MRKRWWVTILILLVVFGSIFGFKIFMYFMVKNYMKHFQMPPASVSVETLKTQDWQPVLEASGQLIATQGAHLTPRDSGTIEHYFVKSGDQVQAGTLMVSLNHDQLSASLEVAKAKAALAKIELSRQQRLYQAGATPRQSLDEAQASFDELNASVAMVQAEINDRLIYAPFDGKVGILPLNIGQYVNPGDDLGMISDDAHLWVEFPVTQQALSQIETGFPLQFTVDAYPGVVFKNQIHYLDNYFSSQTYSLMARGEIDNQDSKHPLYPGMMINVKVLLPVIKNVIVVNQEDIVSTLYGDSVFLVEGESTPSVKQVFVRLGQADDDKVLVIAGLKKGDEIVTSGQMKLQDGMPISIVSGS